MNDEAGCGVVGMEMEAAAAFPRWLKLARAGSVQIGTLEMVGEGEQVEKYKRTLAFRYSWSLWESSAAAFTTVQCKLSFLEITKWKSASRLVASL